MRAKKMVDPKLVALVEQLADELKFNWMRGTTHRDAADRVLALMAELGLIEHKQHPMGGDIWIVGDKMFGRTDGIKPPR
jgi:hypothetical protein